MFYCIHYVLLFNLVCIYYILLSFKIMWIKFTHWLKNTVNITNFNYRPIDHDFYDLSGYTLVLNYF